MNAPAVPESALVRKALAEGTVGDRVRATIVNSGKTMTAAADELCVPRSKLYEVLDSQRRAPLTFFECSPDLERAWLSSRAEALGLVVQSRESSGQHSLMSIVRTFSAAMSAAAESERDGHISPDEADVELRELAQVREVIAARESLLLKAKRDRGLCVVGGGR
jgi:hypothetical protein